MEFEFVEVYQGSPEKEVEEAQTINNDVHDVSMGGIEEQVLEDEDDEFEFPLFASGPTKKSTTEPVDGEEERGRSTTRVMKVSLRDASEEKIVNERNPEYYFARFSEVERNQFMSVAVTFEDIYSQYQMPAIESQPWKVLDVGKYNKRIEEENARETLHKRKIRRRAGKKKRENIIQCKERKDERARIEKKIEKEKQAKLKKKMFHKRGGKKNKKKATTAPSKPKYKTE